MKFSKKFDKNVMRLNFCENGIETKKNFYNLINYNSKL